MKVALFTNHYLSSNYKYQTNKQAQPSFQGMTNKVPKEINDAFSILRKKVATLPERGSNDVLTVKLIDRADEAACVTVERKRKNWLLSFIFDNTKEATKAEVTHSKGDKKAIQALLKDQETKKELNNFLTENGVTFNTF